MFIDFLARLWATRNKMEQIRATDPEVVVAITYSSSRERLAIGTEVVLTSATDFLRRGSPKFLAYSNPDNCYAGSGDIEDRMKLRFLEILGIPESHILHGESSMNSITEAEAVKKLIEGRGLKPRAILVVCTMLHSRSVRYIWERIFPKTRVLIWYVEGYPDVEPGHQIVTQRSRWAWFLANVARHAVIRTLGINFAKKFVHPNAG